VRAPWQLHLIALIVVVSCIGAECLYLFMGSFMGTKMPIPDVLIGRILGTLDAALVVVLSFYFTASINQTRNSEQRSTDLVSSVDQSSKGEVK